MREGVGQPSRRRLTETEKNIESWRGRKFSFLQQLQTLYFQIYKRGIYRGGSVVLSKHVTHCGSQ
jgi:hypothetical protein